MHRSTKIAAQSTAAAWFAERAQSKGLFRLSRISSGEDARFAAWTATPAQTIAKPGPFSARIGSLAKGKYEFHAVIHHPLPALYGAEIAMEREPASIIK